MSDWDDLFSVAAGQEVKSTDVPVAETPMKFGNGMQDTSNRPKKKRKRKSAAAGSSSNSSKLNSSNTNRHNKFQRILQSRTDPMVQQLWSTVPTWLSPGASLCYCKNGNDKNGAFVCRGWESDSQGKGDDVEYSLKAKCKNCQRSLLHHSLSVRAPLSHGPAGNVLESFALVRDIRCCCSSLFNEAINKYGSINTKSAHNSSASTVRSNPNWKGYAITAKKKANQLLGIDIASCVPSRGEAEIIVEKFNKIANTAHALKEAMKRHLKRTRQAPTFSEISQFDLGDIFDEIVQLMIDCDAAYFRMYYLQISGSLPISALNDTVYLPHPPAYFGSPNITWNVLGAGKSMEEDYVHELATSLKHSHKNICSERWNELIQSFGVTIQADSKTTTKLDLDPLSYMHRNRLSESIFIFHRSQWIHSKHAKKQTIQSLKLKINDLQDSEDEFYTKHETPAATIVKKWRDSCRDLLCNLYAYATLSPSAVNGIKRILAEKTIGCDCILEMGAGTGYIAHLLSKNDLNVLAYDVAPTTKAVGATQKESVSTSSNEYHGASPPFYDVGSAESRNLRSVLRTNNRDPKKTALLLCYPPPLSDMAEEALKSFIQEGGKTVIHIGEFAGLTGSYKFEELLRSRFNVVQRVSCLHWGTDAAETTVWSKSTKPTGTEILVECSKCQQKCAISRCRLSRQLCYCSSACFDAHKDEREVHFAFNLIPTLFTRNEMISFHESRSDLFYSIS